MLRRLRTCAPARVAAGLLLVSLTGAPRLVGALAPASEHRCTCQARGAERRCECPICKALGKHAQRRDDAKSPPCHSGAAAAPAEETPAPRSDVPCFTRACGAPEPARAPASGLAPFALLRSPAPVAAAAAELPAARSDPPRSVSRAPDPPPPRA